ncbi:MAG: hypothetical protein KGK08_02080 [Acidobacteriota bacterium]|nr:hypothetical protein [Acidobacteriota bacterium]
MGLVLTLLVSGRLTAQQSSSQRVSSSSSSNPSVEAPDSTGMKPAPRIAQPEAGGSAITLETSEPLFDLATALNTCGYDADLEHSAPVRMAIRREINDTLAASAEARTSRDAICKYIHEHTLADSGRNLAQYVSLAAYLTPPPELTTSVDITDLPPDSTQVVEILPLLRTFNEKLQVHALWVEHRPEYEALVNLVHDPLTRMILDTNIYLHMPVSSYEGRRFLVLLEPMLSPAATNARIYGNDFLVVASPAGDPLGRVHMDEIRHTYLHFLIEPLVYARAQAMDRLLPLLKPVQDAPLEFTYKSDIVALLTECLIKAVEARTMDVGIPRPKAPRQLRDRSEEAKYEDAVTAWEHDAEQVRRRQADLDMRQGWVLVGYFYDQLGMMERDSISLRDNMGAMVYGMDVGRQENAEKQIQFLPEGSHDSVRRVPQAPTGLRLAELKLMQGDTATAESLAQKALDDPKADQAEAHYVLARGALMDREGDTAISEFQKVLASSHDPRTLAWSHIYLGRLYDVKPDRDKAVAEYRTALAVRDDRPDTRQAAEQGLKQPFALPKREAPADDDDNTPLDPSGKAEKEAYRPENSK